MFRLKPKYEFQWEWCDGCQAWFIRCPKCGNNCCNGTYGEVNGEECDICSLSYSYQHLADKTGESPSYIPTTKKEKKRIYFVE